MIANHFLPRAVASIVACAAPAIFAAPLEIVKTPILTATLPAGSTWQVESFAGAGPWESTGVLAAGASTPVTVRMDGFPASSLYRFSQVGATATVVPTIANGFNLAGTVEASSAVGIETSPDLTSGSWEHLIVSTADTTGRFTRVLRPPFPARAFFRSHGIATPARMSVLTTYDASTSSNMSGFGPVMDDMPALYRDGYIAAVSPSVYNRDGAPAAAAGECYELTGPGGTATVIVADVNPNPPFSTNDYFDLDGPAFLQVTGMASGLGNSNARLVPAPVTGNVKVLVGSGSSIYYGEFAAYNHRAGVARMEVFNPTTSTWVSLPRTDYNRFIYTSPTAPIPIPNPLQMRIISRFGETVTVPPLQGITPNQRITANAQFVVFPEQAPPSPYVLNPIYTDQFSTSPGDSWSAFPYAGATVSQVTTGTHAGTASAGISNLGGFNGVILYRNEAFARPEFGVLQFAMKSGSATPSGAVAIIMEGSNGGVTATSATVTLPPVGNSWRFFRIPLDAIACPSTISGIRIACTSGSAQPPIVLDSISFLQP